MYALVHLLEEATEKLMKRTNTYAKLVRKKSSLPAEVVFPVLKRTAATLISDIY